MRQPRDRGSGCRKERREDAQDCINDALEDGDDGAEDFGDDVPQRVDEGRHFVCVTAVVRYHPEKVLQTIASWGVKQ